MKSFFNIALLVMVVVCLAAATLLFGGVLPEYALPVYAAGAVLILLWGVKLLTARRVSWAWSPLHVPLLAFAVYTGVRYWCSPIEYESRVELLQVALYTLLYFAVAFNLHRSRDRAVLLVAVVVLAFGEAFYGLWQMATNTDLVYAFPRPPEYHGRGSGTYFCPNHLAGLLTIVLCLLVARTLIHRSNSGSFQQRTVRKLPELYAAIFLLAGVWATFSRGAWVSLIVATVALLLWSERARAVSPRLLLIVFCGVVVLTVAALNVPSIRARLEPALRFNSRFTFDSHAIEVRDLSLEGRTLMWQDTIRMIRDHLALGTGPGTWQWIHLRYRQPRLQLRPQYAHSDVLHLASDYGLIGFGLIVAVLGCFFWQVLRLTKPDTEPEKRAWAAGAAMAVLAILVHSFIDFNMHIPANAMLLAVIIGSAIGMGTESGWSKRREMATLPRIVLGVVLLLAGTGVGWCGVRISLANRQTAMAELPKQMHEWDRALFICRRALAFDANFPAVHAQMGEIYRLQSEVLEDEPGTEAQRRQFALLAVGSFQRSVELNAYQPDVLLRLALAYEQAGQRDAALQAYQRVLTIDPNSAFNLLLVGLFYHRIGDDTQAVAYLKRSAELNHIEPIAQEYLRQIEGK